MKLIQSLQAIHYHLLFQQFSKPLPFPPLVDAPPDYRNSKDMKDFLNFHIFPWELEILAKEVVINSPKYGASKSLAQWPQLVAVVNKLKALEGKGSELYANKDNVLIELHRIAHRQFSWQHKPTLSDIAKYWKLYSDPELSSIIEDSIGLPVNKLFLISMSAIGSFLSNFILWYPPEINVSGISQSDLDKYLDHFCKGYDEIKSDLKAQIEMNEKYPYAYHSLKAFPIIKIEHEGRDALICPLLTLLFRRITEGIYYEIYQAKNFDTYFGNSFQNYIGGMLENSNNSALLLAEETYGSSHNRQRTIDWIFGDKTGLLFIECKTKRLTFEAKVSLTDTTELREQIGILADAVVQSYKEVNKYINGQYPHIEYDKKLEVYPVVVTLEEWFLFGDALMPMLEEEINNKLSSNGLDLSLVEKFPYTVCSVEGLNLLATVSKDVNLKSIMHEKLFDSDKRLWHIDTYLMNKYPTEIQKTEAYGEKEFNEFINSELDKNK